MELVALKAAIGQMRQDYAFSERRACGLVEMAVASYRYRRRRPDEPLRTQLVEMARAKPRYGYRRLHVLLRREGEVVNIGEGHYPLSELKIVANTKSSASIRVFGQTVDFDALSATVGHQPSLVQRAGDLGRTSKPFLKDMWCLSSPLPGSESMEAHLLWLRNVLSPHYPYLRKLKSTAEVRSFCGVIEDGATSELKLSPESLSLFTDLPLEMELNFIFLDFASEYSPSDVQSSEQEIYSEGQAIETFRSCKVSLEIRKPLNKAPLWATQLATDLHAHLERNEYGWSLSTSFDQHEEPDTQLMRLGSSLSRHISSLGWSPTNEETIVVCKCQTSSDQYGFSFSPITLRSFLWPRSSLHIEVTLV